MATQLIYEHKSKQEEEKEPIETSNILIYADKGRITQVVYNLLDNAIKFTPDGIVSVVLAIRNNRNNSKEIILSIKDNGTAIISNLFSVFASKSDTGTGLGLFISKNIIETHGGHMWGESNVNEKGATFSFSFPYNMKV